MFKRCSQKRETAAHGFKAQNRFFASGLVRSKQSCRIEIKLSPLRTLEWPFVFETLYESIDVPNLELHRRVFVSAVLFVVEAGIKETEIQVSAAIRVKREPV